MIVLVDYDNVAAADTRRGLVHVIAKITSKISPSELNGGRHLRIRLYGGWYERSMFTTRAQNISADVSANFPNTSLLSDNSTSVIVNCEMAYSMLADPMHHLLHTYRSRGIPSGLKARHPNQCSCHNANCPIVSTYQFVRNNVCGACNTVRPEQVFFRGEQKLVDTMLTSDLIFLSMQQTTIGLVSSDDDFWPGIKTSLINGSRIIQLHTKSHTTPTFYTQNTGTSFIQKHL